MLTPEGDLITPVRREWRGTVFDSQLEADWAATLTHWGIAWRFHPGAVRLADGTRWLPDFYLEDLDILLEVKGWHDERIDKPRRAAVETGMDVIIGRPGYVPPEWDVEYAIARWEDARPPTDEDHPWVITWEGSKFIFTRSDMVEPGHVMYFSSDVAIDKDEYGIRMYKAVGEKGIK